jgi:DNA-binding NarL/FixJ family response regulator
VIRVVLADNQARLRTRLRTILGDPDDVDDIDVVGEAANGEQAIEICADMNPDVVLMDVRMPGVDGVDATRAITSGNDPPRVVVLTTTDLDGLVYDALRAGASGFLRKDAPDEQLIRAIRVVAGGSSLFEPSATRRLVEEFAPSHTPTRPPNSFEALTEREREALARLARGESDAEIANALFVTEHTVQTHVARLLRKLGLRDRVQAVVLAYESGFVQPGG